MGRSGSRATATFIFATVGLSGQMALPASALPLDHGQFAEVVDEAIDDFCGAFAVKVTGETSGHFLVKSRGDGLPYQAEMTRSGTLITNRATGKAVRIAAAFTEHDADVRDNGDGTLTITLASTGRETWTGPAGQRLIQAGRLTAVALVDDNGTPADPFDDELIAFVPQDSVGRNDFATTDGCQFFGDVTSEYPQKRSCA
jgi:hypothetical protein